MISSLLLLLPNVALGQDLPDDPPPPAPTSGHPKHVIVPDPFEDADLPPPSSGSTRRTKANQEPSVPPRIARKTPRLVEGEAPVNLHGRYRVVEVTQAGVTEDFPNKMERAGRALNEDCIITHQVFDFGPLPEVDDLVGHRPTEVALTRVRECDVGGLGKYADQVEVILPATWSESEGQSTLQLPKAKVVADYVRLKQPTEGDMPTPPQWLAPDATVDDGALTYIIIAERTRRPTDQAVLHLTTEDQVFHLEADPIDNPFDLADQAAQEAQLAADGG